VAAVLMEPMIGGSGMIVYQDGYLRGVREICDRHGIALIFDEVMTGSAGPAPGSPASTGTCCRT
jgi:taurine---2-oxoglutarate transaminase